MMTKDQYQAAFEAIEKAAKNNQISWPGALARVSLLSLEYERQRVPTVEKLAAAAFDVVTDYVDVPDHKHDDLKAALLVRFQQELTRG